MTAAVSHREVIARACDLLEQWTGFSLRDTAPQRIAETFRRRARHLGYSDPMAYFEALRDLPPTADEPQQLVNLITNGLTAFWRDEPQLSALQSVLRHLHTPMTLEPIYVWCAGVSTGEEAYTVAMIADEQQIPVDILGTDINTDFLDTAREGVFSSWSLRRLSAARREQYLAPADDDHWRLDHPAFDAVRFAHHNILASAPPSAHPDGSWDIILCRNVLIYFSDDAMTTALGNLAGALTETGYLMFGSSEQIHPERLGPDAPHLRSIRQGGGFLYRPGGSRTGQTIEPGRWDEDGSSAIAPIPRPHNLSGLEETTSDASENNTVLHLLGTAADHLDDGELERALACLEAALGYDPFQVEGHCLMGSVLSTLGASQQALEAFQRALFLQPHHWFASHRTATIHQARGDVDAARRAFQRTLDDLSRNDDPLDDTIVLRDIIGSPSRVRLQAERQATAFLRLHRARE